MSACERCSRSGAEYFQNNSSRARTRRTPDKISSGKYLRLRRATMKRLIYAAIVLTCALPVFAQGPQGFVGDWKSDPGTPTMTRKLTLDGKVIVMTELQPGRNGGPELTIIRKYPTDGSEVSMDTGMWAGAKATGKMEGNVLTVDTTMANGRKFHDVWTL